MEKQIKYNEIDIRELIKETSPPYGHALDKENPVSRWGYFTDGPTQRWIWIDKELYKTDEKELWKVYALIEAYWRDMYEDITRKCEKKLSALGVKWWED